MNTPSQSSLTIPPPQSADDLPPFGPNVQDIEYSDLHGYRLLASKKIAPAFAFGFGLSYTTFAIGRLVVELMVVVLTSLAIRHSPVTHMLWLSIQHPVLGAACAYIGRCGEGDGHCQKHWTVRQCRGCAALCHAPGRRAAALQLPKGVCSQSTSSSSVFI